MKISFEYDSYSHEDKDEILKMMNAWRYWSCLDDIDNEIRTRVKHGDDADWPESVYDFLDKIRDEIRECKYE